MESTVRPDAARGEFRLAELVAALSLGVDLGFDQPMEHVLRQCVISLRLADRVGLTGEQRATLYYTALMLNVGCHSDAHEQAKWFGDDIAMKALKYRHDLRSLRGLGANLRLLGAGLPPLHRMRVGLEFALAGHRDVDGMIDRHADIARSLARQLGLDGATEDAVAASYERWDGRGWPGRLAGTAIPLPARITQLAEYVEVAHRVGGVPAALGLARERSGRQFDPGLVATLDDDALVPFHEYLSLGADDRDGKTPFIHMVGAERRLERWTVSAEIVRLAGQMNPSGKRGYLPERILEDILR